MRMNLQCALGVAALSVGFSMPAQAEKACEIGGSLAPTLVNLQGCEEGDVLLIKHVAIGDVPEVLHRLCDFDAQIATYEAVRPFSSEREASVLCKLKPRKAFRPG